MKQPVRIISRNFEFLCEIDDYEQLVFRRLFTHYGDFEMTIGKNKMHTEYLQKGNILMLSDKRSGFIEHIEGTNNTKSETLQVKGFTLEHILWRRFTYPLPGQAAWTMKAGAEDGIKKLVDYNLGASADFERRMPEVEILPVLGRGGEIEITTIYEPLDEVVQNACISGNVGICAMLDYKGKKFKFDVIAGKDLTAGQSQNPPVIFSYKFDNILEQRLVDSIVDCRNTAITGGEGEGAERKIIIVHENDVESYGLDRREVFADIRESGIEADVLIEKGREKLAQYPKVFTLDGKINTEHSVKLGRDYDLGDMVTMRYNNTTLDTRITEVMESWAGSDYNAECVFGNRAPTLLDKIKKEVRR